MRHPRISGVFALSLLILSSCNHPHNLENRLQGAWLLTEIRATPVEERHSVIYTFAAGKLIADGLPGPRSCSRIMRVNEEAQTFFLGGEECPWASEGFPTATDYAVLAPPTGDAARLQLYDRSPGAPGQRFELIRIDASRKQALIARYRIGF